MQGRMPLQLSMIATMLERFWALDPLARRAVIAAGLFGLMLSIPLFPTCDFTVWLFFIVSAAFL
jgi:hypothetical protein